MKLSEAIRWNPKRRWTAEEKVEAFDSLRNMAKAYVRSIQSAVEKDEFCDDNRDEENYIFEAVLELLGEEVWDVVYTLIG